MMERCVCSLWCKLHHDRKFVLLFESTNVDIEEYDDGIGWGVGSVCSPMPSSSMSTIRYCLSTMCHFHLSACVCVLVAAYHPNPKDTNNVHSIFTCNEFHRWNMLILLFFNTRSTTLSLSLCLCPDATFWFLLLTSFSIRIVPFQLSWNVEGKTGGGTGG